MPSGAKKRKAAKKKKENKASSTTSDPPTSPASTTTTHSLGDEDLKHHESDGDHNSEQHLTEGEEEEVVEKREEGSSRLVGNATTGDVEKKSDGVEKRVAEEQGVVQIERELKPDDEFDNKKGSLSSSSSSSSDDESHAVEKDIVVTDNAPVVDIFEAVDSLSKGHSQLTCTTPVSKIDNSVQEAAADFGVERVSLPDLKAPADSSASPDNSLTPVVVELELKENGESKSSSHEGSTTLIEVVKDLAPEHKNDEVINAAAASETKESAAGESQDNAPRDNVIKDSEHVKDSEVPGSSDGQPFVASAHQPVQTTTWKSCCGLFELFTGSNR